MRVGHVSVRNFRGIAEADIPLPQHALLAGRNNSCKSTILEALDLALGPDRGHGPTAIGEHDFHRGVYEPSDGSGEQSGETKDILIEVVLRDLSAEERARFKSHIEPWHHDENRQLTAEELAEAPRASEDYVLRIGFRGFYDVDEDDFATESVFLCPQMPEGTDPDRVRKSDKRAIGFLYLRGLRTARRAASLQRGSLLDILLRVHSARPRVWRNVLERLRDVGTKLDEDESLRTVLDGIEENMRRFVPLLPRRASGLNVSRLTREHLRSVVSFFLASADSAHHLPYDALGAGTSNVLVLALLTSIAKAKENVIFAMEEPEIAIGPHTQRRIIKELRTLSSQVLVTSHSPYVAEQFLPDSIVVLRRRSGEAFRASLVRAGPSIKTKALRRNFRARYAEGLLAEAVLVVEGATELLALPVASDLLASVKGTEYCALDVSGVVPVDADGDGSVAPTARFFRAASCRAFAFTDALGDDLRTEVEAATELHLEHGYSGFEALVCAEVPEGIARTFVEGVRERQDFPGHIQLPNSEDDAEWRDALREVLSARKGEGYSALLLSQLRPGELPKSVLALLARCHLLLEGPLPHGDALAELMAGACPEAVASKPLAPPQDPPVADG